MRKENGRIGSPSKEEAKRLSDMGKKFSCSCGEHLFKVKVEFGKKVICSQCGSEMQEEV